VPLHLVRAPIELTGKTKLVNLDNIRTAIDSSSLAPLLAAPSFTGRVLGESKMLTLPNRLVLVGTGNHIRASGEIAKRSVPIHLEPNTDAPEDRDDFQHPDLPGYVAAVRPKVLGCLLGIVRNWLDAGQPTAEGVVPLGGFEAWARAVSGILHLHGFTGWRTNERGWRRAADPEGEDLRALVQAWQERYGPAVVSPSNLARLAIERDLFPDVVGDKSEHGATIALSKKVLQRNVDRPVPGGLVLKRATSGHNPGYRLEYSENSAGRPK